MQNYTKQRDFPRKNIYLCATFSARYFNNKKLTGDVVAKARLEKIDFFISESPAQGVNKDGWSMIAESELTAPETGEILFTMKGDDAYRLLVNGKEIFSDWGDHAETTRVGTCAVEKGQKYAVRIEFYDNEYNAILRLGASMIEKK